jgi:cobalt-precorrin-7 (C5)-methyltransferase
MLFVVGTGPGDPDYLTVKALKTLERCRVVAGWPSVLKRLPLGGKEAVPLSYRNQEELLKRLAALSREADVCLAVHGDPAVSDWELMERVRALGVSFEVVSGVSSVNVALARLGLDLVQVVVSQHAREPQPLPPAECGRHILVIPPPGGVQKVVEELRARGCESVVLEDLTLPTERVAPAGEPSADLVIVAARCGSARPT